MRGYGVDVPLLAGWQSDAKLYSAWVGARAGWDRVVIEPLTSEPSSNMLPGQLDAKRWRAGGLVGASTGFRHLHLAIELGVAYESIQGDFQGTQARVKGISLSPATALCLTF